MGLKQHYPHLRMGKKIIKDWLCVFSAIFLPKFCYGTDMLNYNRHMIETKCLCYNLFWSINLMFNLVPCLHYMLINQKEERACWKRLIIQVMNQASYLRNKHFIVIILYWWFIPSQFQKSSCLLITGIF